MWCGEIKTNIMRRVDIKIIVGLIAKLVRGENRILNQQKGKFKRQKSREKRKGPFSYRRPKLNWKTLTP